MTMADFPHMTHKDRITRTRYILTLMNPGHSPCEEAVVAVEPDLELLESRFQLMLADGSVCEPGVYYDRMVLLSEKALL